MRTISPSIISMSSISLTLSPQSNVLDGIVFYEPIDAVILDKLIFSDLLRVEFNNKNAGVLYDNKKQQLMKYKSKMVNGRVPVEYRRPKNNPFGRSNPLSALGLYPIVTTWLVRDFTILIQKMLIHAQSSSITKSYFLLKSRSQVTSRRLLQTVPLQWAS